MRRFLTRAHFETTTIVQEGDSEGRHFRIVEWGPGARPDWDEREAEAVMRFLAQELGYSISDPFDVDWDDYEY